MREIDRNLRHRQGDTMQELLKVCTVTGEVCGVPSADLQKALEGYGVKVYSPYLSM